MKTRIEQIWDRIEQVLLAIGVLVIASTLLFLGGCFE
tara:strand:+ start:5543 stop:5653 length:111 start_codon:yes stop_codon:yes gene_type:complete